MGFNATKETGYPASETEQAQPSGVKASDPPKKFNSPKDISIALQVGFKVAGPAVSSYATSLEDWLAKTVEVAHKIKEEILK